MNGDKPAIKVHVKLRDKVSVMTWVTDAKSSADAVWKVDSIIKSGDLLEAEVSRQDVCSPVLINPDNVLFVESL